MFAMIALALSVAPWTGPEMPGSQPGTTKFRITVAGAPGQTVALAATHLPRNWIGSWCTPRVCQPFNTTVLLPGSGRESVEFQIIPDDHPPAHLHPRVRITARAGGTSATAIVRG